MKIKYYHKDDILVLQLSNEYYDHAEMERNVIVHFTKDKRPVRIEIINASSFLKEEGKVLPNEIKKKYFAAMV